ncbi:MAG: O-antigen ligase family protein [Solirubrobacterales bacterium]
MSWTSDNSGHESFRRDGTQAFYYAAAVLLSVVAGLAASRSGPAFMLTVAAAVAGSVLVLGAFAKKFLIWGCVGILLLFPATIATQQVMTGAFFFASYLAVVYLLFSGANARSWAALLIAGIPLAGLALTGVGSPATVITATAPILAAVSVTTALINFARTNPAGFRAIVVTLIYLSIPIVLLAIYQRVTGTWPLLDQFARLTSANSDGRSAANFGHPIIYGVFAQTMAVSAWFYKPKLWQLAVFGNVVGLVLSGTRGSWLAFLIMLALSLIVLARQTGRSVNFARTIGGACAAIVFAAVVITAFPAPLHSAANSVETRLDSVAAKSSTKAREARARLAVKSIGSGPETLIIGHGPGAAQAFWIRTGNLGDTGAATFDSSYLTVAYDYGILGGGLLSLALILFALFPGQAVGRIVVVGLAVSLYTFDWAGWPSVICLIAIGIAQTQARPAPARTFPIASR